MQISTGHRLLSTILFLCGVMALMHTQLFARELSMYLVFRRQDEILGEDGPILRDVSSYIAARKQFAVEDDDDFQKLKTQKYQ